MRLTGALVSIVLMGVARVMLNRWVASISWVTRQIIDNVTVTVIADGDDGLNRAMDLDFNPEIEGELWIVNAEDDSVIVSAAYEDSRTSQKIIDPFAMHFMDNVSAISFGAPGFFATSQESINTYNGKPTAISLWGFPLAIVFRVLWEVEPGGRKR